MYSPQDYLDAIEQTSVENKSKAIVALQQALQRQQNIIQAAKALDTLLAGENGARTFENEEFNKRIDAVRLAVQKYYKP
jgi:gamma-glutamyl phosphate reductase